MRCPARSLTARSPPSIPQVDAATRNIRVQATVPNPEDAPAPRHVRQRGRGAARRRDQGALPSRPRPCFTRLTATRCSSWRTKTNEKSGQPGKAVRQQFVRLGEKRGDFVAVVSGLKEGETVVSTAFSSCATARPSSWTTRWPPNSSSLPSPTTIDSAHDVPRAGRHAPSE